MTPQTFVGATSREVLQKVKQALGDDALIVSNRPVANGVEVTALAASVLSGDAPAHVPVKPAAASIAAAPAAPSQETEGVVAHLMRELNAMKGMMQRELAGMAWSNLAHHAPARAATMQRLLDSGFSPALAREMIAAVPENASAQIANKAISGEIARRLPLTASEPLVEQGGVYALVGPTGVGKTTTVAKLAARCVVRHGASSLALLTTDSYRIAAHDQLRVYGKILNTPVHAIKDGADLKVTLGELRDKRTIIIDTVGMSQRDQMVAEQTAMFTDSGVPVKRLLLLNATANAATLDEVIDAYAKGGVHGCIISKVDESASVATALDAAIRHKLTLHYVTNGQRVPEDLHIPNTAYLLHRALQPVRDGAAHSLRPDEFSLVMAAQAATHGPARGIGHA